MWSGIVVGKYKINEPPPVVKNPITVQKIEIKREDEPVNQKPQMRSINNRRQSDSRLHRHSEGDMNQSRNINNNNNNVYYYKKNPAYLRQNGCRNGYQNNGHISTNGQPFKIKPPPYGGYTNENENGSNSAGNNSHSNSNSNSRTNSGPNSRNNSRKNSTASNDSYSYGRNGGRSNTNKQT